MPDQQREANFSTCSRASPESERAPPKRAAARVVIAPCKRGDPPGSRAPQVCYWSGLGVWTGCQKTPRPERRNAGRLCRRVLTTSDSRGAASRVSRRNRRVFQPPIEGVDRLEPAPPAPRTVLPMQLRVGDRFADETGEWEVVGPRTRRTPERTPAFAFGGSVSPMLPRSGSGARTSASR